jgi:hypothetical protein
MARVGAVTKSEHKNVSIHANIFNYEVARDVILQGMEPK